MYYDYHTHTSFSDDSDTPLRDMLEGACAKGLTEICITDHYDPGYPDNMYPFDLPFDKYMDTLAKAQKEYASRLSIKRGIEIGIQHHQLEKATAATKSHDYDYIIGSFHCALGEPLYEGHFFDNKTPKESFLDYYRYMYDNLKVYKDYCNLGHMNIVARYSNGSPAFSEYSDYCEAILKMIIQDGKGIELNTSSFKYKMETTCPSEDILKMYKSLGGEIISIGSDAHDPQRIADHFDYATDYLKSIGFKYIAAFTKRKPEFIKL